jgi:predicted HAD superfamily Cof-like phosphohydrolase
VGESGHGRQEEAGRDETRSNSQKGVEESGIGNQIGKCTPGSRGKQTRINANIYATSRCSSARQEGIGERQTHVDILDRRGNESRRESGQESGQQVARGWRDQGGRTHEAGNGLQTRVVTSSGIDTRIIKPPDARELRGFSFAEMHNRIGGSVMPEVKMNGTVTVSLDEQSKKAIDELNSRLEWARPIVPIDDRENELLCRFRDEAKAQNIPIGTALLRRIADAENRPQQQGAGFSRQLKRIQELESEVATKGRSADYWRTHAMNSEKERDTFGEQVDHMLKQIDVCHSSIERLESERDVLSAKSHDVDSLREQLTNAENQIKRQAWELQKANGNAHNNAGLLVDAREELRKLKAQNRTVCIRDMFVQVLPHQERNDRPTVPSEAAIRLQTRIDAEEFVEKLDALYDDPAAIAQLKYLLRWFENHSQIRKDLHARLPEFADALADCAVTNEGFAVLFGINLEPVFQIVHESNLRKKDGPIVNNKRMKPEGWQAPDVAGELVRQGWQPSVAAKVWHGIPIDEPIPYRVATNVPVDVRMEGSTDGQNWCELHGVKSVDGFPCGQCEDPRYPGNELAALAELAKKAEPTDEQPRFNLAQEEPIVLMLGASTISEKQGSPVFSMSFATNDTSTIARCNLYMSEQMKVIPEPVGMRSYPVSLIKSVHVRPAAPSDAVLDRRYSVEIEFWKFD